MKPLVLAGKAASMEISGRDAERRVFRLQTLSESGPRSESDVAIVEQEQDWTTARLQGYSLAISRTARPSGIADLNSVQLGAEFAALQHGDVVRFQPEQRRVKVIYRRNSLHNSFLVTERCNNYCLMCSQPPKDVQDGWILEEIAQALELVDPETSSITFTGGEPLTDWRRFLEVLGLAKDYLPSTRVHVLTNGRAFASPKIAKAWADVEHPTLAAGIPVYSAVDHIHDYVVQAKGAFDETILGILRLKDLGQRVEVRVVLHAITAPRLRETCAWFARNLPFVDHIALMGMENAGFAIANDDALWIDPIDYQADLAAGVEILSAAGVSVSIYNLPLCVLAPSARPFAVQSISDWKNGYVEECDECAMRSGCAGFFSSGRPKFSRGIAAIEKS